MIHDGSWENRLNSRRGASCTMGERRSSALCLSPDNRGVRRVQALQLEGRASLILRSKPFSFHLLNQSCAVYLEQLRCLARNPIGLSKRADD